MRQFSVWNTISLAFLGLFFWFRVTPAEGENFIFWPGGYVLSIWVLSQVMPTIHQSYHQEQRLLSARMLLVILAFGVLHLILTGVFILLLERLFRMQEHYALDELSRYFKDSWYYAIEGAMIAVAYLVVLQALHLVQRLREERERHLGVLAELRTSDLKMLKSELNPHFLYNAMNGISMKVRLQEGKTAINMIASLTDLLRTILSSRKVNLVAMDEEIVYLNKYLSIEEARFGKQAKMELSFPDETRRAMVPPLILQPIVENAFKHGPPLGAEQAFIRVSAQKVKQHLVIEVFNANSADKKIITDRTDGVGLPNVIHRLRQLYGVDFQFQILNQPNGVMCKLTLPFRT